MISICIPVYNFDITSLISKLDRQINLLKIEHEIIVIDDCSSQFTVSNKNICKEHTYISLPKNIGRTKIRNLFLKYAKYEYLLFLDCDSFIETSDFLSQYTNIIKEKKASVIYGGRVYQENSPKREKRLRWKYGILRESKPAFIRRQFDNKFFMTNNFLVHKNVLKENNFDERITEYGQEDTFWGFSLKKKNITITHIDNPVTNGHLERNGEYLKKMEKSMINLVHILKFTKNDIDFINSITILKFYSKIEKIESIINFSFKLLKPIVIFLLSKGFANLYLFDFYKLGILIENIKTESKNKISCSEKKTLNIKSA